MPEFNSKKIVFLSLIFLLFFNYNPKLSFAESSSDVEIINAIDTIAGYSGLIKAQSFPNTEIEIIIKKPAGTNLIIPATTDDEGIADLDLYAYHTKKAGTYKVAGKLSDTEEYSPFTSFRVHPDELSLEKSSLKINKQTIEANNIDHGLISVQTLDKYGNAIPYHHLNLISSRPEDQIVPLKNKTTNQNGEVIFSINSEKEGVSIYTAFDNTTGETLQTRIKVIYRRATTLNKFIGGEANVMMLAANDEKITDTKNTDIGIESSETTLKLENIESQIKVNENINFKVSAHDKNDEIDTKYLGEIHFSAESDPNAALPPDYQFIADDLGEHTFSLSLSFATPGSHTLKVNDIDDLAIKGEQIITVVKDNKKNPDIDSALQILSPQEGSYNYRNIVIEGEGPPLKTIKINDNDNEIGQANVDAKGKFSFTSEALNDGKHILSLTISDDNNNILNTSEEVTIQIDTAAPTIDTVDISPSTNLKNGDSFTVKLYSEKNLSQAAVIFNDNLNTMISDLEENGLYTATLTAPNAPGEYSLDIVLVDELGNENTFRDQKTITVQGDEDAGAPNEIEYPSTVRGIETHSGENKIILTWEATESKSGIKNYRIYYGTITDELDEIVDTFDSSTTWYIPNLAPETTYYFALTAINNEDNESSEKSEIISGPTLPSAMGGDDKKAPAETFLVETPENSPESGPEIIWLIACSLFFVEIVFIVRKKLDNTNA